MTPGPGTRVRTGHVRDWRQDWRRHLCRVAGPCFALSTHAALVPEIQGLSGFSPKPTAGTCPSQQRRGPGDPRVLVCDSLGRWAGKTAREPCGEPGSPGDSPPKARESPLRSGHSRDGAFRANQAEGKSILKDT